MSEHSSYNPDSHLEEEEAQDQENKEWAQDQAKLVKTVAIENKERDKINGIESSEEITAEEYETALINLENLIRHAEDDKSWVGTVVKSNEQLMNIARVFPNTAEAIRVALVASGRNSAAATGREYVPLGEGLKRILPRIKEEFKKGNETALRSLPQEELDRLQKKISEIDS